MDLDEQVIGLFRALMQSGSHEEAELLSRCRFVLHPDCIEVGGSRDFYQAMSTDSVLRERVRAAVEAHFNLPMTPVYLPSAWRVSMADWRTRL